LVSDAPTSINAAAINENLIVSSPTICQGEMASIEIQNSENDVSYQLRRDSDDLEVGEAVLGNGGTITLYFNPVTTTTFNILATATIDASSIELANKSLVTVKQTPRLGITYGIPNIPIPYERSWISLASGNDFEIIDIDGDNKLDAVYTYDGVIKLERNLGQRAFETVLISGGNYKSISVEDIDGDGLLDILAGGYYSSDFAWFRNTGNNVFVFNNIPNTSSRHNEVIAADLTGNGKIDLLSLSRDDDEIKWFENDGTQSFSENLIVSPLEDQYYLSIVDLDRDGDLDILVGGDGLYWFENDGEGSFTAHEITVSGTPRRLYPYASDIDSDGDIDIAYTSDANTLAWLKNDGYQQFTEFYLGPIDNLYTSVACADMDNDGDIDIVSETGTTGNIGIYHNDGNENFTLADFYEADGDRSYKITIADMDKDGGKDVLIGFSSLIRILYNELFNNQCSDEIQLTTSGDAVDSWSWTSNGTAIFSDNSIQSPIASNVLVGEEFTVTVETGDGCVNTKKLGVKQNLRPAIFVSDPADCDPVVFSFIDVPDGIYDIFYDGGGSFNNVVVESGEAEFYANAGSYNNLFVVVDGCESYTYPDLVVSKTRPVLTIEALNQPINCSSNGSIDFSISTGETGLKTIFYDGGSFSVNFTAGMGSVSAAPGVYNNIYFSDTECNSPVIPQAVLLDAPAPKVAIQADNSILPITFSNKVVEELNRKYSNNRIVDFDRDGDIDILNFSYLTKSIFLFKNNGQENFESIELNFPSNKVIHFSEGDIDGDNDNDILAAIEGREIVWYENLDGVNFSEHFVAEEDSYNLTLKLSDMDNDNDLDILLEGYERVWWYENNLASFDVEHLITDIEVDIFNSAAPIHFDLNQDGNLDFVRLDRDFKLWYFFNDGSQNFTPHLINLDFRPYSCIPSDLDLDGDIDFIIANSSSGNDYWLENDGNFSFTANDLGFDKATTYLYDSDIDHDGDIDILLATDRSEYIYWYLNDGNQVFSLDSVTAVQKGDYRPYTSYGDINLDGDIDMVISYSDRGIFWCDNSLLSTLCSTTQINLSETGGEANNWEWSSEINADFDNSQNQNPLVSNLTNHEVITVTVQDARNCSNSTSIVVKLAENPAIEEVSVSCGILTISFTNVPDGEYDLNYDGGAFNDVTIAGNIAIFEAETGAYNNLSISVNGCTSNSNLNAVVNDLAPIVNLQSVETPSECGLQGKINLTLENLPQGTYTFGFDGGQFENIQVDDVGSASISADPGVYKNISIVGYGSCTNLYKPEAIVLEPPAPNIGIVYGNYNDPLSFEFNTFLSENYSVQKILHEDIDGDNDLDILVLTGLLADELKIIIYENLDGTYQKLPNSINDSNILDVQIGNFNNDGLNDLVTISYPNNTITWYDNLGGMVFTPHEIVSTAGEIELEVADFNSDGYDDISYSSTMALHILENNNIGGFNLNIIDDNLDYANSHPIHTTDLNQDNFVDIILPIPSADNIAWYKNLGDGSFVMIPIYDDVSLVTQILSNDLNNDGYKDLIIKSYDTNNKYKIQYFENDGLQSFTAQQIDNNLDRSAIAQIADINNDGSSDIVLRSNDNNTFYWYKNLGNATFEKNTLTTPITQVGSFEISDYDNDGDNDIIFARTYGATSLYLMQNNLLTGACEGIDIPFQENGGQAISYNWTTSGSGSFDNDGIYNPSLSNASNGDSVTLQIVGANQCTNQKTIQVAINPLHTIAAELSDPCGAIHFQFQNVPNGNYDITFDGGQFDQVEVIDNNAYVNAAPGTYTNLTIQIDDCSSIDNPDIEILTLGPSISITSITHPDKCGSNGVILLQIDNTPQDNYDIAYKDADGIDQVFTDVFVNNSGEANIITGAGTYDSLFISIDGCSSIDFPSVLLSDPRASIAQIRYGNVADPLYFDQQLFDNPTSSATPSLIAIDLDQNGYLDYLSVDANLNIIWNENQGNAVFVTHILSSSGGSISTFDWKTEDIDNDGDIDIVFLPFTGYITALLNDGNQNFTYTLLIDEFIRLYGENIGLADLDSDGNIDVIAPNISGSLVWFRNSGLLNFNEHLVIEDSFTPMFETIDFDLDGDIDIVGGPRSGDAIYWYENSESNNFIKHEISTQLDGLSSISVVDMDGDGDMDLLSSSQNDFKIAWYKNNGEMVFEQFNVNSENFYEASKVEGIDFNNDGYVDVMVSASDLNNYDASWFENDGSQTFTENVLPFEYPIYDFASGDYNNDGDIDLIGITEISSTRFTTYLENKLFGELCTMDNIQFEEIGGYALAWDWQSSLGATFSDNSISNPIVNDASNQEFISVEITDENDCQRTKRIQITILPEISILASVDAGCGNIEFTFENIPDGIYNIYHDDGVFEGIEIENDQAFVNAPIGTYTNIYITYLTCSSNVIPSVVINNTTPILSITNILNPVNCNDDGLIAIQVEYINDGQYDVSYDGGEFSNVDIDVNGIGSITAPVGIYNNMNITYNACTSFENPNVEISGLNSPSITGTSFLNPEECNGDGEINLTISNIINGTYDISHDEGVFNNVEISEGIAQIFTGSGIYNNLFVDFNGCQSLEYPDFVLKEPLAPYLEILQVNNPQFCNTNGEIILKFDRLGDGVYDIDYDGGVFNDVNVHAGLTSIEATVGIYNNLSITANACTSTENPNAVILAPEEPIIALGTVINPETCSGNSGSIELTGLVPLTQYAVEYLKDGTPITPALTSNAAGVITISDLSAGIYSDIKVSLGNCTSNTIASVTLSDEQNLPGIFVDSFTNPTKCDNTRDGAIHLSFNNVPNGEYVIQYDGGSFLGVDIINNLAVVERLGDGIYENLKVTVGACISSEDPDVSLSSPMPEITILEEIDPLVCGGEGEIVIQVLNSPNNFVQLYYLGGSLGSYFFSDDTPQSIPALAGNYDNLNIAYFTYNSNCISVNNPDASISDPAAPEITVFSTTDPLTCEGDGTIELDFNQVPNGTYNIDYDGGSFVDVGVSNNAATISAVAGLYKNLSITSAECTSMDGPDAELRFEGAPTIAVSSISYPPNCTSNGAINFAFSNVPPDDNYTISYEGGTFDNVSVQDQQASVFAPVGNYSNLSITVDGCTSIDNPDAIVTFANLPTISIENIVDPTTCGGEGTIELSFTNTPDDPAYEIFYDGGSFEGVNVAGSTAEITTTQGSYNNLYHTVGICSSVDMPDVVIKDPEKPILEVESFSNPTECGGTGSIRFHIPGLPENTFSVRIYYDGGFKSRSFFFGATEYFSIPFPPGDYNNMYYTVNNCTSEEFPSVTISEFPVPAISLNSVQQPATCSEMGIITLSTTNLDNGVYDFMYDGGVFANISVNANSATIDAPIGIYNNLRLEITNCITAEDIDIVIATPETPTIGIDQINQPVNCIDGGSIDFVFTGVSNGSYTIDYDGGAFNSVEVTDNAASVTAQAGIYNNFSITIGDCESVDNPSAALVDPPAPNAYISYGSPQLPLSFVDKPLNTTNATSDVFAEDFNGDGHLDMLAIVDNDKIAWYENDGLQNFTEHFIVSNDMYMRALYPGDINGDGKMDFVAASSYLNGKILWYQNDGLGGFNERSIKDDDDIRGNYSDIFVKDMDSDGDNDVIVADLYNLVCYENLGGGVFTGDKKIISSLVSEPKCIFVADMDADGKMDVLSASMNTGLLLHHNLGSDIFEEINIPAEPYYKYAVFAEDIDQDGDLDILSGGTNDSRFAWHENTAPLTYQLHSLSSSNERNTQVFAADMDNDGDIDLFSTYSYVGGRIYWHENDGSQNFTEHEIDSYARNSLLAVDLDQDGDQDVLTNGSSSSWRWYDNQYLTPSCNEASIALSETGEDAVFWLWTTEGSGTFNNRRMKNPTISNASNLDPVSVTIEDNLGCTNTQSIRLPVIDVPTISVSVESICGALEFSFTNVPDGQYNIDYDGGSFTEVEVIGNQASIAAETGFYENLSITVFNCTSAEFPSATVTKTPPGIQVTGTTIPEYCNGEGIIHLAFVNVKDSEYNIFYDDGVFSDIFIEDNAADISTVAGTYNNLYISHNSCTSPEYPDVILPDAPPLEVNWIYITDPAICGGNGQIEMNLQYTLPSSGEYFLDVYYDGGVFRNVRFDQYKCRIKTPAGVYDNIIVDFNGCRTTEYLTATMVDPPIASITQGTIASPTNCGAYDGSIQIEGLETNLEYEINYTKNGNPVSVSMWSDATGSITITGLAAGEYDQITASRLDCESNALGPITLSDPTAPSIAITTSDAPTCDGNGIINFTFGNVPDDLYTIFYDGGAFLDVSVVSGSASVNVPRGIYANLRITIDECTSSEYPTATVQSADAPTISVDGVVQPVDCDSDGTINLSFTNVPDNIYDIAYNGGAFSDIDVASGIATITTPAGSFEDLRISVGPCNSIENPDVSLTAPGAPTISILSLINPSECGENGTINFSFTNVPDDIYTISYDGGSFNSVVIFGNSASINTMSGVYNNLRITVAGCTSSEDPDVILVNEDAPTIQIISTEDPATCGGDGTINLSFTNVEDGVYAINYDGGQFQNVDIDTRIASILAPAGRYESLSISIGDCESVDDPDAVINDPPLPNKNWTLTDREITTEEAAEIEQSGYEPGVEYELRRVTDDLNAAGPVTPTGGGSFKFAPVSPTSTTEYYVLATNPSTGCSVQLSETATVTVTDIPLPVELLTFMATNELNAVKLDWTTASETDNDYFSVERSLDGEFWSEIGQVKGSGTTTSVTAYTFTDHHPVVGYQYYRLMQVDFDGEFEYSKVILVLRNGDSSFTLDVYPVPLTSEELFLATDGDAVITDLTLVDATGKQTPLVVNSVRPGLTSTTIRQTAGVYVIIVDTSKGQIRRAIVVY
jgi:hypothetical protein